MLKDHLFNQSGLQFDQLTFWAWKVLRTCEKQAKAIKYKKSKFLIYSGSVLSSQASYQTLHFWNKLNRLRIPTGRRQTSWLYTSAAEELSQGQPETNPASSQSGTWTQNLQISSPAPWHCLLKLVHPQDHHIIKLFVQNMVVDTDRWRTIGHETWRENGRKWKRNCSNKNERKKTKQNSMGGNQKTEKEGSKTRKRGKVRMMCQKRKR